MTAMFRPRWIAAAILIAASFPAFAQQAQQQRPPATAPAATWETMPRMILERQYAGPLRDTVVQRWRDPVDGTICYIYLPINAQHSPPGDSGFVQYGANTIGSISCLAAPPAPRGR
jgi:hypothetical protein